MWSPQQLMLPMLVAFSLTGACVGFLYLLGKKVSLFSYKKSETNSNLLALSDATVLWFQEDDRRKRKKDKNFGSVEMKVSREFVPAIIGRGGAVLRDIQESTSVQISFKEESDVESPVRVCLLTGKIENIRRAEEKIKSIITNQPLIETYETYVPEKSIGRINGAGGRNMKQIQHSSKAKVILTNAAIAGGPGT